MPRDDIIIELFGQNTRGLKTDDKLEELRGVAAKRKAYAVGVQETWRIGQGTLDSRGWKFVTQGKTEMTCNRGSGGVGILLCPDAVRDWEAADSEVLLFGERILAVRLQLKDADKRSVRVLLASAYAPVSSAPQAERDAFLSELENVKRERGSDRRRRTDCSGTGGGGDGGTSVRSRLSCGRRGRRPCWRRWPGPRGRGRSSDSFFDLALRNTIAQRGGGADPSTTTIYDILGLYAVSLFEGAVHLVVTLHFVTLSEA